MKIGRIPYVNCYPVYGAIDRGCVPGDNHLTGRVDVRRTAHLTFGSLFACIHDHIQISTQNRRHRSDAYRHRFLHITTARPHCSNCVRQ